MFYQQFGRYFYMKIIVTIIPEDLVTNSSLSSFWPFLQAKNKNQGSQQVGSLVTRNICFLFIASCALIQNHAEFNRLSKKNFFCTLFLVVLQFHDSKNYVSFGNASLPCENTVEKCTTKTEIYNDKSYIKKLYTRLQLPITLHVPAQLRIVAQPRFR